MNRIVYLAGPITGLSYAGATDWREFAKQDLAVAGLVGLSPLRAKTYLEREHTIRDDYPDFGMSTAKAITARDRFDCQRAGMVLLNLLDPTASRRVSIGSCIEIGWADAARVPMVLVIEATANVHDHAMVRECIGWRVETLEEGLHVAKAVLLP